MFCLKTTKKKKRRRRKELTRQIKPSPVTWCLTRRGRDAASLHPDANETPGVHQNEISSFSHPPFPWILLSCFFFFSILTLIIMTMIILLFFHFFFCFVSFLFPLSTGVRSWRNLGRSHVQNQIPAWVCSDLTQTFFPLRGLFTSLTSRSRYIHAHKPVSSLVNFFRPEGLDSGEKRKEWKREKWLWYVGIYVNMYIHTYIHPYARKEFARGFLGYSLPENHFPTSHFSPNLEGFRPS